MRYALRVAQLDQAINQRLPLRGLRVTTRRIRELVAEEVRRTKLPPPMVARAVRHVASQITGEIPAGGVYKTHRNPLSCELDGEFEV